MAEEQTMKMKMGKLDPKKVVLTLKVDIRELRVRMAIGIWFIKLGARIIGLGVNIESLETPPEASA